MHDGERTVNDQGVECRWDEKHQKWVQADVELQEEDTVPEFMTLEEDGQEEFDRMWAEGITVTEDGYR